MSDQSETVGEQQPSTELAIAEDFQSLLQLLPYISGGGESNSDETPPKINYRELMARDASLPLVAAYMSHEVQLLKYGKSAEDDTKATRLIKAANGILDIVDSGKLEKMSDAHEIICLVEECSPSMAKVKDLILERGYTATGVSYLYDVKDCLGLSIDLTDQIFRKLGLSLVDGDDVSIVDDAIDSICEHRNIPYRDTAAKIMLELSEEGYSLVEIMHGKVY